MLWSPTLDGSPMRSIVERRGKAVGIRHDPVTVIGGTKAALVGHWRPTRGAGKTAVSRTIRESGNLPRTRALLSGLRGEARVPQRLSPSQLLHCHAT